jgi:hypothetical protein
MAGHLDRRDVTPETGTYLYCLVSATRRPNAAPLPPGLPGAARPRILEAAPGLWLVVADVPLERYSEAAINGHLRDLAWVSGCALAHEAVVERALALGDVLPVRLFTIFAGDDRAVAHVRRRRARIARTIRHVSGHLEWGVRVSLDQRRARGKAPPAKSGREYLARKRAVYSGQAERSRRAAGVVRDLHRQLDALSSDSRRRPPIAEAAPGERLLLDAAYLVPKRGGVPFRRLATRLGRTLAADGYRVVFTGPWPAYNFVASLEGS